MLFGRGKPKTPTFDDLLERCRQAGFEVSPGEGKYRVSKNGIAVVTEKDGESARLTHRAGPMIGSEIALLVDGGFQKFFQTPKGVRRPALAADLKAVHEFEEDLREALGMVSLYNESLGSVSQLYLYDRVEDRDSNRPKKPWELQVRGQASSTHS